MTSLTIEEIATLAGVSRSTVSRAINNQPRVSAQVRERVQHIMACTGYTPNTAAQLLAQRRLPIIAVVVTDTTEALFGNPDLARLLSDIATACQFSRCLCALYLFNGTDLPGVLQASHIDGVILVGNQAHQILSQIQGRNLPAIVIERFGREDRPDLTAALKHLLPSRTKRVSSNA